MSTTPSSLLLLQQLTKSADTNVVCSYLSFHQAVAMAYAGLDEKTDVKLKECYEALFRGSNINEALRSYAAFNKLYNESKVGVIANRVWVKGVDDCINADFLSKIKGLADTVTLQSKFKEHIDAWITELTKGNIKTMGPISDDIALIIMNVIQFGALWKVPFDPKFTEKRPFYDVKRVSQEKDFMNKRFDDAYYYSTDDYKLLGLDYTTDFTMLFLLPTDEKKIMLLPNDLIGANMKKMKPTMVDVSIPKFEIETEINFGSLAEELGIDALFRNSHNGILKKSGAFISSIKQKVKMTVDESGTKMSAVTMISMSKCIVRAQQFNANHPVTIYLVHKSTLGVLATAVICT